MVKMHFRSYSRWRTVPKTGNGQIAVTSYLYLPDRRAAPSKVYQQLDLKSSIKFHSDISPIPPLIYAEEKMQMLA